MRTAICLFILIFVIMGCNQEIKKDSNSISPEEQARLDSLAVLEAARADSVRIYEEARAESLRIEEEKIRIKDLRNTIKVINVYPSKPNSAGGVDAHTVWKNTSDKTVKYIDFEWVPFNAVGDAVPCTIRGFRPYRGRVTGPIKPGQTQGYNYGWDCVWYNNTITRIVLTDIDIEYMDGTTKNIAARDIEHVYKKQ